MGSPSAQIPWHATRRVRAEEIHPFIHHLLLIPIWGREGDRAYPSCLSVRWQVYPGSGANSTEGQIEDKQQFMLTFIPRDNFTYHFITSPIQMCVFGLWEEARLPEKTNTDMGRTCKLYTDGVSNQEPCYRTVITVQTTAWLRCPVIGTIMLICVPSGWQPSIFCLVTLMVMQQMQLFKSSRCTCRVCTHVPLCSS